MKIIKSNKLKTGDCVAIVSPSWGGPSVFPHVYEAGLAALKSLGLIVKEYPSARKGAEFLYENPEFRARDINSAFADSEVDAIFASIGGDDSVRILPFLDLDLIRKNPKIIMGFSDATTFNTYLNQAGLVTLNGPAIMAGFSQWNSLDELFHGHVKTFLFENSENYEYKPYDSYSNGYLDWTDRNNIGKTSERIPATGWDWIQGIDKAQGILFGGCIEVLEMMKGTEFWPSGDFWKNKILFLETSEDKPMPDMVKCMLRNYGMQGVFDKISALLIGRPRDYDYAEKNMLNDIILKVVRDEFKNAKLPIVANMDFGHTDPQWILPLGIKAEIDCIGKTFKLIEKPFI